MTLAVERLLMRKVLLLLVALLAAAPLAARASAIEDYLNPSEPQRAFPTDFVPLLPVDAQATTQTHLTDWKDPHVGGWGAADCPAGHVARRPVVFVHGTTEDANFWQNNDSGDGTVTNVRQYFLSRGYCPRELWAISYTGGKGYFTYDDVNVPDVSGFIAGVLRYTGAKQVDVVTHSLGVTVTRKAALVHPELYRSIHTFVAIAGANHGTTSCRGEERMAASQVCGELWPGSPWLAQLNGGDETPGRVTYLAVYDGTGAADNFYLGPDGQSPALAGACNKQFPPVAHDTLALGTPEVAYYYAFLQSGRCA